MSDSHGLSEEEVKRLRALEGLLDEEPRPPRAPGT